MNRGYQSWFLFLIPAILLHLPTLEISPTAWGDELQIVDHGRIVLNPDTDYAMSWVANNQPKAMPFYLGVVIQEWAYEISQNLLGPRFVSLFGAALAATALFAWLRSRKISCLVALLVAITFFENPSFIQSYRGGRLDGAAIAAIIYSALLLRYALAKQRSIIGLFAGGFGALGIWLWPSAALLVGLPLLELWDAGRKRGMLALIPSMVTSLLGCILPATALRSVTSYIQEMYHWRSCNIYQQTPRCK